MKDGSKGEENDGKAKGSTPQPKDNSGNDEPDPLVEQAIIDFMGGTTTEDALAAFETCLPQQGLLDAGVTCTELRLYDEIDRAWSEADLLSDLATFAKENRSSIANGVGLAVCIAGTVVACGFVQVVAWGVRSQQRDGMAVSGADVADGVLSLGTLGLVRVPLSLVKQAAPATGALLKVAYAVPTATIGAANSVGCAIGGSGEGYCLTESVWAP